MLELALIRHGSTAWNAARRFQGQSDTPLSEEGRAQARALSRRLSGEPFHTIVSSDLSRAFETAAAVAEPHGLAVRADVRLREFDFGSWEGLTWDEIVATRPHLRDESATAATRYVPEDGEPFDAVRARVSAVLRELTVGSKGRIAVVTHAGPLHAALAALGLPPFDEFGHPAKFQPASLTRIAMEDGRARLITLSDVRHLYPPG